MIENSPLDILVFSTWFPFPPDNGSKIRAHYLLRSLAGRHSVTLVAFNPYKDDPIGWAGTHRATPIRVFSVGEDPFRHVGLPGPIKFLSPVPVSCWPSREMRRLSVEITGSRLWDAVIALQLPAASYALQVSAKVRMLDNEASISYQRYEQAARSAGAARLRNWTGWRKTSRFERKLARQFQVTSLVSPVEIGYFSEILGVESGRLAEIPNGIDCQHNRPSSIQEISGSLIYNGALTYHANFDAMHYFLAEIFPRIKAQRPKTQLTITGSTKGVNLNGLFVDHDVRFSGYVDDIRPLVSESAVCVVPIRKGTGTRLKILEAMALGTAVISTGKGAEGLDVRDGEHLMLADTPEEFAAKTIRLLQDSQLRSYLTANARKLVESAYDWEHIGARYSQLIEAYVTKS